LQSLIGWFCLVVVPSAIANLPLIVGLVDHAASASPPATIRPGITVTPSKSILADDAASNVASPPNPAPPAPAVGSTTRG